MYNLDNMMHDISYYLNTDNIMFRGLDKDIADDYEIENSDAWEYYYCENCLYLVRHIATKSFMFIDAYNPYEAVEDAEHIFTKGLK